MKIVSAIIIPLIVTGCASTKVINHDFQTVVAHLETRYSMRFSTDEESTLYPSIGPQENGMEQALILGAIGLFCGQEVEVKKYDKNRQLQLKLTHGLFDERTNKITLTPDNGFQTKIKVRNKGAFLYCISRDKENEAQIIQVLEDELSGVSPPEKMMTQPQLGSVMTEGFLTGLIELTTNQATNVTNK